MVNEEKITWKTVAQRNCISKNKEKCQTARQCFSKGTVVPLLSPPPPPPVREIFFESITHILWRQMNVLSAF